MKNNTFVMKNRKKLGILNFFQRRECGIGQLLIVINLLLFFAQESLNFHKRKIL